MLRKLKLALTRERKAVERQVPASQAAELAPAVEIDSRNGLQRLHVDELLLVADNLSMSDRLSLGATNHFFNSLIRDSPLLWRSFRLAISGGEDGHGALRFREQPRRDTRFTPTSNLLRELLSRSQGLDKEIHLDLECLSLDQSRIIVEILEGHALNVRAFSVDSARSEEAEMVFLDFALHRLPRLRFLRVTDIHGQLHDDTVDASVDPHADDPYQLPIASVVPHLETFYYHATNPRHMDWGDAMVPFLSRLQDFDIGHNKYRRGRLEPATFLKILLASRHTTRRIVLRLMLEPFPHVSPPKTIELPVLEQFHLDGWWDDPHSVDFFQHLRMSSLHTLSFCSRMTMLECVQTAAPNLRSLSFEPWPFKPSDGPRLGRYLASLVSLERLELVGYKHYGTNQELCEFFRSFIQDALAGLPSANPQHLSHGHPVALPRLQELSLRRFISNRGGKNDWPNDHVTRDSSLALPLLLRRVPLPSLSRCPHYLVQSERESEGVEVSALKVLPEEYRTLRKLWLPNEVSVRCFWDEAEEELATLLPEEERNALEIVINKYDAFWDGTSPRFPRPHDPAHLG